MTFKSKFTALNTYVTNPTRLFIRGWLMVGFGIIFVVLTILKPDVIILHAKEFSWLPAVAALVFILGLFECFDAFIAKELRDFFMNLQNGVFDIVASTLIIFSVSDTPEVIYTLISAFLLAKGIIGLIIAYELELPHKVSTMAGCVISVVLGLLIFSTTPLRVGWFLAAALSIHIGFRGWGLVMFGFWTKQQKELAKTPH